MVIVAFLQGMWFSAPGGGLDPAVRAARNAGLLFNGSLTGRRLADAFGEEFCGRVVWEDASLPHSADAAPDMPHVMAVLEHFRPGLILGFGRVATQAVARALPRLAWAVASRCGPHPAARHATVEDELHVMAAAVRSILAEVEAARVEAEAGR